MARVTGISSAPNKIAELALLLSPWHALQPAAAVLSRLMEADMDRALTQVGLTAREFVTLLEIATVAFPSGETLAARPLVEGHRAPAAGESATAGERADGVTQGALGARLELTRGGTSELLGRLERRRLIERRAAQGGAHGGRRGRGRGRGRPETVATLTGAGHVILVAAAGIARQVEEDWAMRLAREAAGSNVHYARANGLQRWLTESIAALHAQPASESGRARRAHAPLGARRSGRRA